MKFELNEIEEQCYKEFYNKHKNCSGEMGAIGGGLSIIITPIGLGSCIEVRCNKCGEIEDITDISNW